MTTEHVLFVGMSGCISAIVFLFGLEMKHHSSTKEELRRARERLDRCEIQRAELSVRVALLEQPAKSVVITAAAVAAKLEEVAAAVAKQLQAYADQGKT